MSIRNARQVDAVYDRLGKSSKANDPYVLEYESGGQLLIFFGARHSNDPADTQWTDLEKCWQKFINHKNDNIPDSRKAPPSPGQIISAGTTLSSLDVPSGMPSSDKAVPTRADLPWERAISRKSSKVVLYEQGPLEISSLSKKEALQQECESGLVVWLAKQAGVTFEWPEPDRISQVKHLKSRGYSDADIMTYYFSRQMMQWATRDKINEADWHKYAAKTIAGYNVLGCWEQTLTLDLILVWYKGAVGKDFDPKDMKTIYSLCDPSQSSVSEDSGEFRNITLFGAITAHWQQKKDIFVIYGSGHAIALEPVLEKLAQGKKVLV